MKRQQPEPYLAAFQKACREMQRIEPKIVAWRSDTRYQELNGGGLFEVRFWGKDYAVYYPEIAVRELETGQVPPIHYQIIILHYLLTADGTPLADRWISFRDLPGGRVYNKVFRKRACLPLIRTFGYDVEAFIRAAEALGGERLTFGDASFLFRILPRIRLAVILWAGDEELPPSANVLYDAASEHYLPTEDLAVLGGMLSGRLTRPLTRSPAHKV